MLATRFHLRLTYQLRAQHQQLLARLPEHHNNQLLVEELMEELLEVVSPRELSVWASSGSSSGSASGEKSKKRLQQHLHPDRKSTVTLPAKVSFTRLLEPLVTDD